MQISVIGSGAEHEARAEEAANPWIDHAVATGIGHARNLACDLGEPPLQERPLG